jgi:hypothetical protein
MDNPFLSKFLHLKEIPEISGWGVFTEEEIPVETIIEISPVILFPTDLLNMAIYCARAEGFKDGDLQLDQYAMTWHRPLDAPFQKSAMMTGLLPMYNHSDNNNAIFTTDYSDRLMGVITIKPIKKGEQITVSYGPDWFEQKKSYITPVKF